MARHRNQNFLAQIVVFAAVLLVSRALVAVSCFFEIIGLCLIPCVEIGDDPGTTNVTETDCEGVNGGEAGNLCHVDCSNRGTCDFSDGTCKCTDGYAGLNCGIKLEYG